MTAAYKTVTAATFGTEIIAAPSAKNRRVVRSLYINSSTQQKVALISGYVDEIQSMYNDATGGDFTMTFGGDTTAATAWNANAALMVTRLEAITSITDVTVTGDGTEAEPWLITFVDPGGQDVALLTANDTGLTGDTIGTTIAEVTAGAGLEKFGVYLAADGHVELAYNPSDEGHFECGSAEALNFTTSASGNVTILLGYDTVGGS